MPDPAFLTVPQLGRLLRLRRLSAAELVAGCLDRLERLGPAYEAVVAMLQSAALAEARDRDEELARGKDRGPLHGIPYGVKDLVAVAGTAPARHLGRYRRPAPPGDATVVHRLRRAGSVLCAKLAMADPGPPSADGPSRGRITGRTPWDPSRWSGGSSSGSAAAVAAGLLPFTLGSETWGSIQYPATFCGVTGLRPSFGRVSRHGAMMLSATMDKLGPLARTAEDCGLVLAATAGADPADPTALARQFAAPRRQGGRRYRLGILRGTLDGTQPEVARNFTASVGSLAEVADIVDDLELPDYPYDEMAELVLDAEAAAGDGRLAPVSAWAAPENRRLGARVDTREYLRVLRLRRPAAAALDRLLAQVDALLAPSLPTVAWPAEASAGEVFPQYPGGTSIAGAANLCGAPALFLPNGFGEGGLPTGLQLTGRANSEAVLLELGMQFQSRTDFHRRRPPGL
ncbi:MAG TPA: amidase [Gemmatimonadales bacterium]|nr:amidase [Gemmatimonadales bacterium]